MINFLFRDKYDKLVKQESENKHQQRRSAGKKRPENKVIKNLSSSILHCQNILTDEKRCA